MKYKVRRSNHSRWIALTVSTVSLALIIGYIAGLGQNVLYTAQFKIVDSETGEPVNAHYTFSDRMDVFPKSYRPFESLGGISMETPDGIHVLAWMGRRSSRAVRLPLITNRYEREFVELRPQESGDGFAQFPNRDLNVIKLVKRNKARISDKDGSID